MELSIFRQFYEENKGDEFSFFSATLKNGIFGAEKDNKKRSSTEGLGRRVDAVSYIVI